MKKVHRMWILMVVVILLILHPVRDNSQVVQIEKPAAEKAILTRRKQPKRVHWTEIKVIATAYCSCKKCTGWGKGITASGVKPSRGTIAAPRHIPFNTTIKLEGLGDFKVQDRGGGIKLKNGIVYIDVWMPSHQEAIQFGRKKIRGWIKSE